MTNRLRSHTLNNESSEKKTKVPEGNSNKLKTSAQRDKTKSSPEINHFNSNQETPRYVKYTPRGKQIVRSLATKSSIIEQIGKCGQCANNGAEMKCLECVENYCANCFEQFHNRGNLERHHYVLFSKTPTSPSRNKTQSVSPENHQIEFSPRQPPLPTAEELPTSSRRSVLPRKTNDTNRSKQIPQNSEGISSPSDTDSSNKLPDIELISSKKTSNKNLTDTYRIVDQTNQAVYIHRSNRTNVAEQYSSKPNVRINIRHAFPADTQSHQRKTSIKPLNDQVSKSRTMKSVRAIDTDENFNPDHNLTHEQHTSRKSNSLVEQDSIPPITHVPRSLPSLTTTKSIEKEREAILDPQVNLSRSSSSAVGKTDQQSNVISNIDVSSNVIDQYSIARFNLALDDIVDKSKAELASRFSHLSEIIPPITSENMSRKSVKTTSHRNSPFSFSNSLNKTSRTSSSLSIDAGDDGFFTDVLPQPVILLPILPPIAPERQATNASEHQTRLNSVSSRKSTTKNSSHTTPNHLDEIHQEVRSQTDNQSRQGSSLLSSSLFIEVTSPDSDLDFSEPKTEPLATSSRKNSSTSSISTHQSSSSTISTRKSSALKSETPSTIKKSSPTVLEHPSPTRRSSSSTPTKSLSPAPSRESLPVVLDNSLFIEKFASSTWEKPLSPTSSRKSSPVLFANSPVSKRSISLTPSHDSSPIILQKSPSIRRSSSSTSEELLSSTSSRESSPVILDDSSSTRRRSVLSTLEKPLSPTSSTKSSPIILENSSTTETSTSSREPSPIVVENSSTTRRSATSRESTPVVLDNSSTTKRSTSSSSSSSSEIPPSPKPTTESSSISSSSSIEKMNTVVLEDAKVLSPSDKNDYRQKTINPIENNNLSHVRASQTLHGLSKPTSKTFIRDKTMTLKKIPAKKKPPPRQNTNNDNSSKFRKLEFSLGDGLKWEEASIESFSSARTTSSDQLLNPTFLQSSPPHDTRIYNNETDRSLSTYENIVDKNGFNRLHSELDMINTDENAILNENVLNIRDGTQLSSHTSDVQIFQTQLS